MIQVSFHSQQESIWKKPKYIKKCVLLCTYSELIKTFCQWFQRKQILSFQKKIFLFKASIYLPHYDLWTPFYKSP